MFITVVAIFCVMNTLIVLTVQKTDEIGLLKALGFSSWQVMAAFVLHGWIQCLAGTVLGIGTAFLILNNLQGLVELLARCGVEVFPKNIYGLAEIPWRVVPGEVAVVAVSVIVFCTVASFLPAWRAARMDPVTALRKE
jgi:lipoprotein-releasing system permease protein